LVRIAADRALRAIEEQDEESARVLVRWTTTWPLVAWIASLAIFDWGALVAEAVPRTTWVLRYVALFAPAIVTFLAGWAAQGRVEARLVPPTVAPPPEMAAREGIRRGARRNGLALLPLGIMVALYEGIWALGELGVPGLSHAFLWIEAMPTLFIAVFLAVLLVVSILFLPALFARILRTEPLPASPMRATLERAAAAIGLRYRELMLWRTENLVINAMVVGVTPRTRRVFLTDGLLRALPEEEVLAVFAHEAAHAQRGHLPLFLTIFSASALLFQVAQEVLTGFGISPVLLLGVQLAFLWFVLLGWVSRRFEREADVRGAEESEVLAPGGAPIPVPGLKAPLPYGASLMIRALERIKRISGKSASHRHGTIDERAAYLAAYATDPAVREEFARSRRTLRWGVVAFAVLAVAVTAVRIPADLVLARARLAVGDGIRAYDRAARLEAEGDAAAALAAWEASYGRFLDGALRVEDVSDPRARALRLHAWFGAGDAAVVGLHDPKRARPALEKALALAEDSGLSRPEVASLRFQAHIHLGRVSAWEGDVEQAERRAKEAEADERDLEKSDEEGSLTAERHRLLRATIAVRDRVKSEEGRNRLEWIAGLQGKGDAWEELRREARWELRNAPAPPR
jgi:Zn-dependent protease with chaperone function